MNYGAQQSRVVPSLLSVVVYFQKLQELCDAATKIQASFRGHMTRKQEAEKKGDESGSSQEKNAEEELDIDLTDPDLNNAALKIQASFRGHMVRKENEAETTHN
ncbi:hypothetical protein JTB14_032121 [Gonioctena quinquepunctata]|nr:hypothetical protein JTB14_032121 [Gonioctena quinquepunctata]